MADRATERAEAAESLCRQLQQQMQFQQQQQQRLAEKETTTKDQLKHLRSDGDARVIAEREVCFSVILRCRCAAACVRL